MLRAAGCSCSPAPQAGICQLVQTACVVQFGIPLYGAKLLGEMVFPPDNANGCARFTKPLSGQQADLPAIAIVRRGGEATTSDSGHRNAFHIIAEAAALSSFSKVPQVVANPALQ